MVVVLVTSPIAEAHREEAVAPFRQRGWEVRFESFWPARPEEELIAALQDVDAVIPSVERYTRRVIESAPRLKILSRTGVGYDAIDVEAATARGIAVTTTVGSNNHTVADFTLALMLALTRVLFQGDAAVQSGGWDRPLGLDFFGKMVGLIGMGSIGRLVVRRVRGFDCQVLATDVVRDEAFAAEHGVRYVELDELLRESDYVSLHTPLQPSTRGLIGERELRLMKRTAFLVNTARGPLIQEAALHRALKERWIGGAAIDVFEDEPPIGSPLLDPSLDNLILSPHMAGVTRESKRRSGIYACENVVHVLTGEGPLYKIVNPEVLRR